MGVVASYRRRSMALPATAAEHLSLEEQESIEARLGFLTSDWPGTPPDLGC